MREEIKEMIRKELPEIVADYRKEHKRFPVADELWFAYMTDTEPKQTAAYFQPSQEVIDIVADALRELSKGIHRAIEEGCGQQRTHTAR